jgi:tRNA(Ile)-lysidine synthase TilS/MesJ
VTGGEGPLPRVKPFKYTYEKEIVMYAYFKKLDYFSTECVYAPFAARGFARDFVKNLEVGGRFRADTLASIAPSLVYMLVARCALVTALMLRHYACWHLLMRTTA